MEYLFDKIICLACIIVSAVASFFLIRRIIKLKHSKDVLFTSNYRDLFNAILLLGTGGMMSWSAVFEIGRLTIPHDLLWFEQIVFYWAMPIPLYIMAFSCFQKHTITSEGIFCNGFFRQWKELGSWKWEEKKRLKLVLNSNRVFGKIRMPAFAIKMSVDPAQKDSIEQILNKYLSSRVPSSY